MLFLDVGKKKKKKVPNKMIYSTPKLNTLVIYTKILNGLNNINTLTL